MRKVFLIYLIGIWVSLATQGLAQISTFPSPPPLPPKAPPPSNSMTNNSSATVIKNPNPGDTQGPDMSGGTSPILNPTPPSTNSPSSSPTTASTLSSMAALDDKVALVAGDRISFRVIEDRDDAVPRVVTDTGEVDFPYVGRLKVSGLTCRQVAVQLKKLLEVDYYKRATVIVGLDVIAAPLPDTTHEYVWIVGQVRQVGALELAKDHPQTVSQIILRAGGFGDFADQRKVRLLHRKITAAAPAANEAAELGNSDEGQVVDVKAVFEGHSNTDPVVKPNDLIVVPKRLINF